MFNPTTAIGLQNHLVNDGVMNDESGNGGLTVMSIAAFFDKIDEPIIVKEIEHDRVVQIDKARAIRESLE